MGEQYLRMEAVNVGSFIYDTADLSTIRGGSQLLASASALVEAEVAGLEALSTGASAAIYRIAAGQNAANTASTVRQVLAHDADLKHATFVVDVTEGTGASFPGVRERLLALNRHQQMLRPALAMPSAAPGTRVCAFDGVRPATRDIQKGTDHYRVSESVFKRREFGVAEKRRMVLEIARGLGVELQLSRDFDDLAGDRASKFGNAGNKMAVLFLDGNDFGSIQNQTCLTPEQQQEFDEALQERAKEIIRALVQVAVQGQDRWMNGGRLRLEMLMLAGDEIRLVVPAWCGWQALSVVFRTVAASAPVLGHTLTYKAGMVLCNLHAPIRRMLGLAESLADAAKANRPDQTTAANVFCYRTLESFDVPGELRARLVPGAAMSDLVLTGGQMDEVAGLIRLVQEKFPTNKAYRIAQALVRNQTDAADNLLRAELKHLSNEDAALIRNREVLKGAQGWIHILELADYTRGGQ